MNYVQANADRIERLKKEQLRLARKKWIYFGTVSPVVALMVIHAPKLGWMALFGIPLLMMPLFHNAEDF